MMIDKKGGVLTCFVCFQLLILSSIVTPVRLAAQSMDDSLLVSIEALQIDIMESLPVEVNATVSGALLNGCVTLDGITSTRQGSLFTLYVNSTHSGADVCTTVITPFETRVTLETNGLPPGTYTVMVGEIRRDFILDVDNRACTLPLPPDTFTLEGTRWQLVRGQIGDSTFVPVNGHQITLDMMHRQVGGHGGCNGYTGLYASSGNRLTIRLEATTLVACAEDITGVEARFLALLESAVTYTHSGGELVISSPVGALYFTVNTVPD
jgi:heat shock protein HslJ